MPEPDTDAHLLMGEVDAELSLTSDADERRRLQS